MKKLMLGVAILFCLAPNLFAGQSGKVSTDSLQMVIHRQQHLIDSLRSSNKARTEAQMHLKLFEIELLSKDLEQSRKFYQETLGLSPKQNIEGLKIFDPGVNGIDLDFSQHFKQKCSFSYLVKDVCAYRELLISRGLKLAEPVDEHLNMKSIRFEDPDGNQIIICSPTEKSPPWLKQMAE